jgi:hypothetical protein
MSLENIFITSNRIIYQRDRTQGELETEVLPEILYHSNFESTDFPVELIDSVFSKFDYRLGSRVNFVLDSSFVTLRFFVLPVVSKSKIRNILEFELENSTIFDLSEVDFDFIITKQTEENLFLRVYIVRKDIRVTINEICKSHSLQLGNILPLSELIYLSEVESNDAKDFVYLFSEFENSKIFLVQNYIFMDLSVIDHDIDFEQNKALFNDFLLNRLNSRIKLLQLEHHDLDNVLINKELLGKLEINTSNEIQFVESEIQFDETNIIHFDQAIKNNGLISKDLKKVFKAKNYFLQSISSYKKEFIFTAVSFSILIVFTLAQIFTQFILRDAEIEKLEHEFDRLISKKLSKGVSKSNALYILEKQGKELQEKSKYQKEFIKTK